MGRGELRGGEGRAAGLVVVAPLGNERREAEGFVQRFIGWFFVQVFTERGRGSAALREGTGEMKRLGKALPSLWHRAQAPGQDGKACWSGNIPPAPRCVTAVTSVSPMIIQAGMSVPALAPMGHHPKRQHSLPRDHSIPSGWSSEVKHSQGCCNRQES